MALEFLKKNPKKKTSSKKKKKIVSARSKNSSTNKKLISGVAVISLLCLIILNMISPAATSIGLIYMAACGFIFYEIINRHSYLQQKEERVMNTSNTQSWKSFKDNMNEQNANPAPLEQSEDNTIKTPHKITNKAANDQDPFDGSNLSDLVVTELLHHAVRSERIDIFTQPIVRLPQRQVRFYEIYARIRVKPGTFLPATRYMALAQQDNLTDEIDTILLTHCLQSIKKTQKEQGATPYFINITSATLKNTAFMNNLLKFIAANRSLAPRIVFEIQQEDFMNLPMPLMQILLGIAQLGCAFSLDHVTDVDFDIAFLQKNNVQFIKIDADWMLGEMETDRSYTDMVRLKRKLESNGIRIIAEKLETEASMVELLDYDLHYGQGYLFGRPAPQDGKTKEAA